MTIRRQGAPLRGVLALLIAACLATWASGACALHFVSDQIPDGTLKVPPGGRASLYLDLNRGDYLQWTWEEQSGRNDELATQFFWTDKGGHEHALAALPAGQAFGNFDAPKELLGARLEWINSGSELNKVTWNYYTTAPFWTRPEYFLPAMLPLFLAAGAFYLGRRIDRRRRYALSSAGARAVRPETMQAEIMS